MSKDYVPANVIKFILWAENLLECIIASFARWQAPDPEPYLRAPLEDLVDKQHDAVHINAGKIDILARNEAQKVAEKAFRTYIQGFIARNPNVTNLDRQELGLPVRDTISTPVGDPVGQAEADISWPARLQVQLKIKHVSDTPFDAAANYGYRIYHGVYAAGQPPPASGKELRESMFTRHKKEVFSFEPEDSGKTAYFCIRYENSKGKAGVWGPMLSAVIP